MANLLHLDSSARIAGSVTRELSATVVEKLSGQRGIIRRDLAAEPLPFLDENWVTANFTPEAERSGEQRAALALSDNLIEELEASDILVMGVPIYNFGVPAAFKAWIDLIARARKTFRYTETGPEGLLKNKKAYVIVASGGVKVGTEADLASRYVVQALKFVGINDITIIAANGGKTEDAFAQIAEM